MRAQRARGWCATFYVEPTTEIPEECRYAIYGKETCPLTQNIHWQSYLEFRDKKTMKNIKDMFGDQTVHLEIRQGTRVQARDYCKKDGIWIEFGDWTSGG